MAHPVILQNDENVGELTSQVVVWENKKETKTLRRTQLSVTVNTSKHKLTSSAIAERPRDALYQLTSCQLLHHCTKIAFE